MSIRAAGVVVLSLIAAPLVAQPAAGKATIPMPLPLKAASEAAMPSERQLVPLAQSPVTLAFNGISFTGASYSRSGSTARLQADRVDNSNFFRTTGTLRLALWLSASGYRQNGYRTAMYSVGQLAPNTYVTNVDSGNVPFTSPPSGCYYASVLLEEYQSDGTWVYMDYFDSGTRISIGGIPCTDTLCTLSLSSTSGPLIATGGAGSVNVISGPVGCTGTWSATTDVSWLTVIAGGSGAGPATTVLTFAATANTSTAPRSGKITVAPPRSRGLEQTYTVNQVGGTATACNVFTLSPASSNAGAGASTGSFTITAGPSGCSGSWTATSNAAWLTITSGGSGSGGTTTLAYSLTANTAASQRVGMITVADPRTRGSEQTFTLTQGSGGTCTANATTLCLSNGRFMVKAQWKSSGGQTGAGQAVPITADTGYYWFFGSTNIEMVVKVIDGCSLSNRYWVFAGGLTDVNVTLSVTDTKSGTVRTYTNPMGVAFQPIQDTNAFATCP